MKKLLKITSIILCLLAICCGCGEDNNSSVPTENTKSPLDTVLTAEEQEYYTKFIDSVAFEAHPSWSSVYYYGIKDGSDKLSEIGIKGLPVLINKAIETERSEASKESNKNDLADGAMLSDYRTFTATSVLRIDYGDFLAPNNKVVMPSDNFYTYWNYAKAELPKIAASDITADEKINEYRKFGVFAVPYAKAEIEKGNTDYEKFFALIGAQLTTADYMKVVEATEQNQTPPTAEEIDKTLLNGAENFDYKQWLSENEDDLNSLFTFLDEYAKEYETE